MIRHFTFLQGNMLLIHWIHLITNYSYFYSVNKERRVTLMEQVILLFSIIAMVHSNVRMKNYIEFCFCLLTGLFTPPHSITSPTIICKQLTFTDSTT